jgi:hypothetical protein
LIFVINIYWFQNILLVLSSYAEKLLSKKTINERLEDVDQKIFSETNIENKINNNTFNEE